MDSFEKTGSFKFIKFFVKRFQIYSDKDGFYKLPFFLKGFSHDDSKLNFITFLEEYFKRQFFNGGFNDTKFPFLQDRFKYNYKIMVYFYDKFIGIRQLILSSDGSFFLKFLIPFCNTDFIVI
jgi:hypothetical protein